MNFTKYLLASALAVILIAASAVQGAQGHVNPLKDIGIDV